MRILPYLEIIGVVKTIPGTPDDMHLE